MLIKTSEGRRGRRKFASAETIESGNDRGRDGWDRRAFLKRSGITAGALAAKLRIIDIEPTGPGETFSNVVFGRIVGVHLDERFVNADGRFDTARTEPLTRLDGNHYATVGRMDVLGRPSPRRD